jgi:hypothetical protein
MHIHRHFDGSIDFDRYRAQASALRRSAMQDASRLGAGLKIVAIVGVMLIAVAMAPSRQDAEACHVCKPAAYGQSHGAPAWPRSSIEPSLY